jgi:hypothetical protein
MKNDFSLLDRVILFCSVFGFFFFAFFLTQSYFILLGNQAVLINSFINELPNSGKCYWLLWPLAKKQVFYCLRGKKCQSRNRLSAIFYFFYINMFWYLFHYRM